MKRRLLLLTEGVTDPIRAKTAVALLRYCADEVVAVLDSTSVGRRANDFFGFGGQTPVIASVADAAPLGGASHLVVGVAPSGGRLPDSMRRHVADALRLGMTLVSGMHQFLADDSEFAALAARSGSVIHDVRRNNEREVAHRKNIDDSCLRVHTVGHDCSCGKMITSVEVTRALTARGVDAKFVATGQTGIMIEGDGCPIDCVVADFINGAAERLVLANQSHDVLLVEGQGTLHHPRYSSVTLGLLHGCVPDGLIFCLELGRERVLNMDHIPIPPLADIIRLYEHAANFAHPCRVIGLAMNTKRFSDREAADARKRFEDQFNLPVADPVRHGPDVLADAVLALGRDLDKRVARRPVTV